MVSKKDIENGAVAIALQHMTGPLRGAIMWLRKPSLDVSLSNNKILHISEPGEGDEDDQIVAHLHYNEDTYKVIAEENQSVWVNGKRISSQTLKNRDMIEFGEIGPLTRFDLYHLGAPSRKLVGDILVDGLGYLRVSRKPIVIRLFKALGGLIRQLMRETTLLFRIGVLFSIVILLTLAYQQNRLNVLLQERIEIGSSRLEGFANTLARSREEALTPSDLNALSQDIGSRLSTTAKRLEALEMRSDAFSRVISASMSSVVFLQGAYGFRNMADGRMMRHVVNSQGLPLITAAGQPLLTLEGEGPVAKRQFTGTAFVFADQGLLVTNRHVALPWEKDTNIEGMAEQGLEPVMTRFIAYLPDNDRSHDVELIKASDEADLAILRLSDNTLSMLGIELADKPPIPGEEVIVMGYPTGVVTMLAQSGEEFIEDLQESENTGFWSVTARLAEKGHISPLSSRGIISQATTAIIVYDAETTHGGSGGPVLNVNGQVVAVNAASLPEYGGSNLGVPAAKVRALIDSVQQP